MAYHPTYEIIKSHYKLGSTTEEYHRYVDKVAAMAEGQKARVVPMYHEKIDHLLDIYARKLADTINEEFPIEACVPSILIAGRGNFPVRKEEKQNAARDRNRKRWREVQGLSPGPGKAPRSCKSA